MTKKILIDEAVVKQALEVLDQIATHVGQYDLPGMPNHITTLATLHRDALREALEVNNKGVNALAEQVTGQATPPINVAVMPCGATVANVYEAYEAGKRTVQQQAAEPGREMPSNTRYAVAVEGQALTYWDNIHDAITNAQRAVYAGPNETSRAIDDLKAGRLAEWSYGFSAVRIYPPQNTSTPASKPLTDEQILSVARDHYNPHQCAEVSFARAIEAALGITGSKT